MAFDAIEPFGHTRSDWQSASVCSAVVNAVFAVHRVRHRTTPKDYLLVFKTADEVNDPAKDGASERRQTWQQQKMVAMMYFAASQTKGKKRGRS
jgi:uncharacterized alpha-E superfamily protein